jgi:CRISPR-associated protein Csm4
VVAAAELGGERVPPEELDALAAEPPWVVSSLLPWVGLGGRPVRFVPRPADQRLRAAYVSMDLLGEPVLSPARSRCGTLAAMPREAGDDLGRVIWRRAKACPRAAIDRVTGAAEPFLIEELAMGMGADAGAWIAVRTDSEAQMQFVRVLLGYLESSGLGADRARGLGRFEIVHEGALSMDDDEDPGRFRLLLGYASPDAWLEEALADRRARYLIVRRDGRVHGALGGLGVPRRSLRLIAPGAVVPDRGPVVGRTREVTPAGFEQHRIYRDGRTLALPLPRRDG